MRISVASHQLGVEGVLAKESSKHAYYLRSARRGCREHASPKMRNIRQRSLQQRKHPREPPERLGRILAKRPVLSSMAIFKLPGGVGKLF